MTLPFLGHTNSVRGLYGVFYISPSSEYHPNILDKSKSARLNTNFQCYSAGQRGSCSGTKPHLLSSCRLERNEKETKIYKNQQ